MGYQRCHRYVLGWQALSFFLIGSPMPSFYDLALPDNLLQAITDLGFLTPTDIQQAAIVPLLQGRDVVGIAQTGTGKTAAFGLPLLARLHDDKHVQALILCPTRELAVQGASALKRFAAHLAYANIVAVYGGAAYYGQLRALDNGANIVVGTPGRIMDLMERGALKLDHVTTLVLDEADEMLRMGFAEDVETIAASCPKQRVTALFSATMPAAIERVSAQHLHDPVRVEVTPQATTVDTVDQEYAIVPLRHKKGALYRILVTSPSPAAIVFVRTRASAEEVAADLTGRGVAAAALSSDVPQKERERLVERLRGGSLNVIVATDVAARGLDVDRIGLVVNFDVPREAEAYVHRIGRTGRAGRHGRAVTFFAPREKHRLQQIERLTGAALTEITIPSPRDVSAYRVGQLLEQVPARMEAGRLELYRDAVSSSDIAPADLAAVLLALAVDDAGPREDNDEEIQAHFETARAPKGRGQGRGRAAGHGTRYRVEVGHRDKVLPGAIVGAITGEGGIQGTDIGRIEIFPTFSLVDMLIELDPATLRKVGRATVQGRTLRMRLDTGPQGHSRGGGRKRCAHAGGNRHGQGQDGTDGHGGKERGKRGHWKDSARHTHRAAARRAHSKKRS